MWSTRCRRSKTRLCAAVVAGFLGAAAMAPTTAAKPATRSLVNIQLELYWAQNENLDEGRQGAAASSRFDRIRRMLGVRSLRPLSAARVEAREGEHVQRDLAPDYRLAFRVGSRDEPDRVALSAFELYRGRGLQQRSLMRADLRPWSNRPLVLCLTRSETDRAALLLVLTCDWATEPAT